MENPNEATAARKVTTAY